VQAGQKTEGGAQNRKRLKRDRKVGSTDATFERHTKQQPMPMLYKENTKESNGPGNSHHLDYGAGVPQVISHATNDSFELNRDRDPNAYSKKKHGQHHTM